jgi:alkylation response protein AidB-like acyl-CoA dehydrogenase
MTEPAGLRCEVRAFLAAELAAGRFEPSCDAWLSRWDVGFTRWLAAHGWIGMTVPAEYGGVGCRASDRYVVIEELLAAGAPVAAHWIADRQVVPALLRFGNEKQRCEFLPRICAGECYFAIGMSEPDAGSDLSALRTRAERVAGGWRVSGTKVWASGAHWAHAFIVLVRTSPADPEQRHAGLSQMLVDLRGPGVTIWPVISMSGEHHFNEVVLDGAFVSDDMVVGKIGQGWHQVSAELAFERSGPERFLSTMPLLRAVCRRVTVTGCDDWTRAELGRLVARLATLRQMSLDVACALDRGEAPAVRAALVKDAGTRFERALAELARAALDLAADPGGDELERLLAQSELHGPGLTLRGGTNEILRGVIARDLVLR